MSRHLQAEEFDEVLMGAATVLQTAHLADCEACQAQLERLRSPLALFRESLRTAAESRPVPAVVEREPVHTGFSWRAGWAFAASVVVAAGVVALWHQPGALVAPPSPPMAKVIPATPAAVPAVQAEIPTRAVEAATKPVVVRSRRRDPDAAFFADIDSHVSQRVPSALSPLADLVMPSETIQTHQREEKP